MSYTKTEENYLKAIYGIESKFGESVSTNMLANKLETKASSVTDMVKKLAKKELITYEKYQGVSLTECGKDIAINIIRNHRIWEVFLVEKLKYKWDEVHEIAEQLEHIKSEELVDRLDDFLEHPSFDPHGDPIPDKKGNIPIRKEAIQLNELAIGEEGIIVGVKNTNNEFLQYLEEMNLTLGKRVKVEKVFDFDESKIIKTEKKSVTISKEVSSNLIIEKANNGQLKNYQYERNNTMV
ncbi:MAG: metal-dependent transcriptional regulator [Flavobacteriales bacterium]|nr:metal-dependent transcriptional regulator [Flavobacteriales bacterium]